jgi:hypothetical protein
MFTPSDWGGGTIDGRPILSSCRDAAPVNKSAGAVNLSHEMIEHRIY